MRARRPHQLTLAMTILASLLIQPAFGQSCTELSRELVRLERSGGGGVSTSRYDRAYREQRSILASARRSAEDNNCYGGGFLFFRRTPRPICGTLMPKIEDMETNLRELDRLRRREGGGGGNTRTGRQILRIRSLMSHLGCGYPSTRRFARFGLEQIFEQDYYGRRSGGYRTLCVRACDGYYFPISFSTSGRNFSRDEAQCQAMCPGAEVSLFYHDNPSGDSERMVSLAGAPYSQLPNAFRYRETYDPSCSCKVGVPGEYGVVATLGENFAPPTSEPAPELTPEPTPPFVRIPSPRTGPAEDIETALNRNGSFVPRPVVAPTAETARTTIDPGGRTVRVVGPQYWGGQSENEVVLVRIPN